MAAVQCSGAWPRHGGCAVEDQKEKNDVNDVKQKIHRMVWRRCKSKELNHHHVRDPRERMPMPHLEGAEGPEKVSGVKASGDMGIESDLDLIVKAEERMAEHRGVDGECENGKHDRQGDRTRPHEPVRNGRQRQIGQGMVSRVRSTSL